MDNAEHTLFVCARLGVAREAVIRHPGDEDAGARWASGARQQRGPIEIVSGPYLPPIAGAASRFV